MCLENWWWKKVFIGYDPWFGANNGWKLSEDLIQSLITKGINTLSDTSSVYAIHGKGGWKQAQDIGLNNVLAT